MSAQIGRVYGAGGIERFYSLMDQAEHRGGGRTRLAPHARLQRSGRRREWRWGTRRNAH
jgi:hypothetical protein